MARALAVAAVGLVGAVGAADARPGLAAGARGAFDSIAATEGEPAGDGGSAWLHAAATSTNVRAVAAKAPRTRKAGTMGGV
jgi:hypothetical protein